MARIDTLQDRMIAAMPLPKVEGGIRLAKVRIAAEAIAGIPIAAVAMATSEAGHPIILGRTGPMGDYSYVYLDLSDRASGTYTGSVSGLTWREIPGQEQQAANQVEQGQIPARMVRVETSPTWDLDQAANWKFEWEDLAAGASENFLNEWGNRLQVPRYQDETDVTYARRIVSESMAPSTTNKGMAVLITNMIGVDAQVIDSEGWIFLWRYDEEQSYFDTEDLRFVAEISGGEGLPTCLFLVLIQMVPPIPDSIIRSITDLANRRRAAGTRLGGIFSFPETPEPTDEFVIYNAGEGGLGSPLVTTPAIGSEPPACYKAQIPFDSPVEPWKWFTIDGQPHYILGIVEGIPDSVNLVMYGEGGSDSFRSLVDPYGGLTGQLNLSDWGWNIFQSSNPEDTFDGTYWYLVLKAWILPIGFDPGFYCDFQITKDSTTKIVRVYLPQSCTWDAPTEVTPRSTGWGQYEIQINGPVGPPEGTIYDWTLTIPATPGSQCEVLLNGISSTQLHAVDGGVLEDSTDNPAGWDVYIQFASPIAEDFYVTLACTVNISGIVTNLSQVIHVFGTTT